MKQTKLEEEFQPAFTAWKTQATPETTGSLLKAVSPVLDTAMHSFAGPSEKSRVLRSHAKMLAIDAFPTYNPTKGTLRTHLLTHMQRLRRLAAKSRQILSIPERVAMDQVATDACTRELEDKLGRPPSDAELADHSGLSMKRLQYIRQGRSVAESQLARTTKQNTQSYESAVRPVEKDSADSPWVEFVYTGLDPRDQFIMERLLGMRGRTPISITGVARLLSITPSAVSRRAAKIQEQLNRNDRFGL